MFTVTTSVLGFFFFGFHMWKFDKFRCLRPRKEDLFRCIIVVSISCPNVFLCLFSGYIWLPSVFRVLSGVWRCRCEYVACIFSDKLVLMTFCYTFDNSVFLLGWNAIEVYIKYTEGLTQIEGVIVSSTSAWQISALFVYCETSRHSNRWSIHGNYGRKNIESCGLSVTSYLPPHGHCWWVSHQMVKSFVNVNKSILKLMYVWPSTAVHLEGQSDFLLDWGLSADNVVDSHKGSFSPNPVEFIFWAYLMKLIRTGRSQPWFRSVYFKVWVVSSVASGGAIFGATAVETEILTQVSCVKGHL